MLVFSNITIQMRYLKPNGCNKTKQTKMFPVIHQEGSGPSAACDTGLLSSISGETAASEHLSKVRWHFVSLVFPSHRDDVPATPLAQGPQEGGSHRKINGRSLLLILCT